MRNGRNGRSGKLSYSSDEIGACICSNVDLHVCVCTSAHWGYVVNGSVATAVVLSHYSQFSLLPCNVEFPHSYCNLFVWAKL